MRDNYYLSPAEFEWKTPLAFNESSTSVVIVEAGALRVLGSLALDSLDVLFGMQAEGEGMGASCRLRLRDGRFETLLMSTEFASLPLHKNGEVHCFTD